MLSDKVNVAMKTEAQIYGFGYNMFILIPADRKHRVERKNI